MEEEDLRYIYSSSLTVGPGSKGHLFLPLSVLLSRSVGVQHHRSTWNMSGFPWADEMPAPQAFHNRQFLSSSKAQLGNRLLCGFERKSQRSKASVPSCF